MPYPSKRFIEPKKIASPPCGADKWNARLPHRFGAILLAVICFASGAFGADDPAPEKANAPASAANKLTFGWYKASGGNDAWDVNLRHSFASSTGWIGGFRDRDGFQQARAGWEYDLRRESYTFVPSLQVAGHGFAGMSLYGEIGRDSYLILGFGRTNLRPYANLNFDPNDAVQLGVGWRNEGGETVSTYVIRDDRLGTGQTSAHLTWRHFLAGGERLTADLLHKQGRGDEDIYLRAWSLTLGVDWREYFARIAVDPHANYGADRQTRFSFGYRF